MESSVSFSNHSLKFATVGAIAALAIYYWPVIREIKMGFSRVPNNWYVPLLEEVLHEDNERLIGEMMPIPIAKTTFLVNKSWLQVKYKITGKKSVVSVQFTPLSIFQ